MIVYVSDKTIAISNLLQQFNCERHKWMTPKHANRKRCFTLTYSSCLHFKLRSSNQSLLKTLLCIVNISKLYTKAHKSQISCSFYHQNKFFLNIFYKFTVEQLFRFSLKILTCAPHCQTISEMTSANADRMENAVNKS